MIGPGPNHPVAAPDQRATRAEIDLDALQRNVELLRGGLAPGTELMAVVKANAYGHGARMVAETAIEAGASWLGVATVGEGRQLRAGGIAAPVLVLSPISPAEAELALQVRLDLTIATPELLAAITDASRYATGTVGVHIKVDTGMNRYGADPELAAALARQVAATPGLRLAGLMTHFASADDPDERFSEQQAELFRRCLTTLEREGIAPERRHLANSAATLRGAAHHADLVRIGIAMYGLRPSATIPLPAGVRPVMTVRSTVGRVHALSPGSIVGYGGAYRTRSAEQAVLVPIGYADGYRRGLSNLGWMMVAGQRAEVAGRVSMDQTVVRLPIASPVSVGDDVVVFGGAPGSRAPSADELADLLETISYEVVSGISPRVPRRYMRGGQALGYDPGASTPAESGANRDHDAPARLATREPS
ncbi:MAG: alanine racemase [Chloroflexota bacterium]|nr:alanine racemase [Chloroflexota bacterium]